MSLSHLASSLSATTNIGNAQAKANQSGQIGSGNNVSKDKDFAALLAQLLGTNNKHNKVPEASGPIATNSASSQATSGVDITA